MKIVENGQATGTLAAYTEEVGNGPVVVTDQGKPVAVLVPIENADLETVALSTNPRFTELIERSRARVRAEGGISCRRNTVSRASPSCRSGPLLSGGVRVRHEVIAVTVIHSW